MPLTLKVRVVDVKRCSIYSQAGGSRAEVTLSGSASSGYVGRIVVGVNPKRTTSAV